MPVRVSIVGAANIAELLKLHGDLIAGVKNPQRWFIREVKPEFEKKVRLRAQAEIKNRWPSNRDLTKGLIIGGGGGGRGFPTISIKMRGPARRYAAALNVGAHIKPVRWKHLTIPLAAVKNSKGHKTKTPWDFPSEETFTTRTRAGNLIMFRKEYNAEQKRLRKQRKLYPNSRVRKRDESGKFKPGVFRPSGRKAKLIGEPKITPLFWLVTSTYINATHWANKAMIKAVKEDLRPILEKKFRQYVRATAKGSR